MKAVKKQLANILMGGEAMFQALKVRLQKNIVRRKG